MIIKKENRFVEFIKRFGLYIVIGMVILGVTLTFAISAAVSNKSVPTAGKSLQFALPMTNPEVIKNYSDENLQRNDTFKQYEAHLALDLSSEDGQVYSVLDGTVANIYTDELEGLTVAVEHADGFVSYYASLDNLVVSVGDKIKAGENIGVASVSAINEKLMGAHLHFYLMKNDTEVDPNLYFDLELK